MSNHSACRSTFNIAKQSAKEEGIKIGKFGGFDSEEDALERLVSLNRDYDAYEFPSSLILIKEYNVKNDHEEIV